MTGFVGWDDAEAREEIADERVPGQPELGAYEHLEGLVGEEEALLKIPAEERSEHQHHRLRELGEELDRVFEKLHVRSS
jgi:hypothetical protein